MYRRMKAIHHHLWCHISLVRTWPRWLAKYNNFIIIFFFRTYIEDIELCKSTVHMCKIWLTACRIRIPFPTLETNKIITDLMRKQSMLNVNSNQCYHHSVARLFNLLTCFAYCSYLISISSNRFDLNQWNKNDHSQAFWVLQVSPIQ